MLMFLLIFSRNIFFPTEESLERVVTNDVVQQTKILSLMSKFLMKKVLKHKAQLRKGRQFSIFFFFRTYKGRV